LMQHSDDPAAPILSLALLPAPPAQAPADETKAKGK
jgi:hypothetical protein